MGDTGTSQEVVDLDLGIDLDIDGDGFVPLRIRDVVRETADAVSLVLDTSDRPAGEFRYQAGQFLTIAVRVGGQSHRRCYSMSSSPVLGEDLRITVKRDRGGVVSNWLNDHAAPGGEIHAAPPQGRFVLGDTDRDLITFAGGSGITPVFSLVRSALAATPRRCRLFYANRSADSIIFGDALAELQAAHQDRFTLQHHLDADRGIVTAADVEAVASAGAGADFYVCGPAPFMDTVEKVLLTAGVAADRLHLERFTVAPVDPSVAAESATEEVTIKLGRQTITAQYRGGNTILQTARLAGMRAPSSCETGSCGTCIAQVTDGTARMLNNDALDDDEVADGWVVTCQALPTSRTVRVVYE
jgi:ferredoxin-NADP reductase